MGKAWKLETDRSKALTDRGSQASQATVFRAQRTGTRRSELRRGQRWRLHFARAAACAALRVACLAAPTARRERVGDRADSKQRKETRAARCLLAAAEACTRRRGQYGGFFAADTACAGAACLAASTTSEKLAAGGCDFRCVAACILKAPTTRRERVGVGDRTPRRRAQRGCTLLH